MERGKAIGKVVGVVFGIVFLFIVGCSGSGGSAGAQAGALPSSENTMGAGPEDQNTPPLPVLPTDSRSGLIIDPDRIAFSSEENGMIWIEGEENAVFYRDGEGNVISVTAEDEIYLCLTNLNLEGLYGSEDCIPVKPGGTFEIYLPGGAEDTIEFFAYDIKGNEATVHLGLQRILETYHNEVLYSRDVGDINGDGIPDVFFAKISSPDRSSASGDDALNIFSSLSGLYFGSENEGRVEYEENPDVRFQFDFGGFDDFFQASITGVGDLNGDGCDDFAIGVPQYGGTGKVFLFFGKNSGFLSDVAIFYHADLIIEGRLVDRLRRVGSITLDREPALLVGAPGADGGVGRVSLFLGTTLKALWEDPEKVKVLDAVNDADVIFSGYPSRSSYENPGSSFPTRAFGMSAGSGGDVLRYSQDFPGDHIQDLLIGAPGDQGRDDLGDPGETAEAYIYSGEWLEAVLRNPVAYDSDKVYIKVLNLYTGTKYIPHIFTSAADWKAQGNTSLDEFSHNSWSTVGRVISDDCSLINDETEDFVITAPSHESGKGAVYLFEGEDPGSRSGSTVTKEPYLIIQGENPGDRLGQGFASLDVDGDYCTDLLIGAPEYDTVNSESGEETADTGAVYLATGQRLNNIAGQVIGDPPVAEPGRFPLIGTPSEQEAFFGIQISIVDQGLEETNNPLIMISAPGPSDEEAGMVYFFEME